MRRILRMSENLLEFYYTDPVNKIYDIEKKIVEIIYKAKKKIFLCSFLINSEPVVEALLKKASELKGHIYCITAININYIKYLYDKDIEPYFEKYNFKALERLSGNDEQINSAIAIRGNQNAHAKFIIIDDEEAFITSANFTKSSFRDAPEVGIYTNYAHLVKPLNQLFKDCYLKRYSDLQGFKDKPILSFSVYRYNKKLDLPVFNFFNNDQATESLVWTYNFQNMPKINNFENSVIKRSMVNLIKQEEKYLDIFTYSLKNLEDTELLKALIEKIKDPKVNIRILIFSNDNKQPYVSTNIDNLVELSKKAKNSEIRACNRFHAKGLISSNCIIISSANLDGELGLNGNFEAGIISKNEELKSKVQTFFNSFYNNGYRLY